MKLILIIIISAISVYAFAKNGKKGSHNLEEDLKSSYLHMARGISNGDPKVESEISLYFDSKDKYFSKFEGELYERGIESASDIEDVIVLINALVNAKSIVYRDVSSELKETLMSLNSLTKNELSKNECFQSLLEFSQSAKYGLGTYLQQKGHGPSISACIEQSGFALRGIDEGSDSYSLVVIRKEKVESLELAAQKSGVRIQTFL